MYNRSRAYKDHLPKLPTSVVIELMLKVLWHPTSVEYTLSKNTVMGNYQKILLVLRVQLIAMIGAILGLLLLTLAAIAGAYFWEHTWIYLTGYFLGCESLYSLGASAYNNTILLRRELWLLSDCCPGCGYQLCPIWIPLCPECGWHRLEGEGQEETAISDDDVCEDE